MKSKIFISILVLLASGFALDYRQALPGYRYEFPRDHFNHEEFQTEWWYYTGNLRASDGHRFGFELTFFRQGTARNLQVQSVWAVQDIYLAHFALSDIDGQRFYHDERINRSGPGLAGVDQNKKQIWNGNWQVQWSSETQTLRALSNEITIALTISSQKPPVIHGAKGVSQKAEGSGQASHYISLTRLHTKGTIEIGEKVFQVEGLSWMDHEFFTNSMDPSQSGWDWLSLQFNDNTELMLYRLRRKDGSVEPYSSGTFIDAAGKSIPLARSDFIMEPLSQSWTSPQSGARYPIQWRIAIPKIELEAEIATPLQTQEMFSANRFTPTYWEGAVDLTGTRDGRVLTGSGYLELTGYARPFTLAE